MLMPLGAPVGSQSLMPAVRRPTMEGSLHRKGQAMKPRLDKNQVMLLRRLNDADHLNASELHDFATLMGDDLNDLPGHWLDETYDAFDALGLLHKASGQTFGASHARLSPRGRWFLQDLDEKLDAA